MSTLPATDIASRKRELRKQCAAVRDALAPELRATGAQRVAACGIGFSGAPVGATVSAYSAMGSELDPGALVERLAREGMRTCLPVVTPLGNPLQFRSWMPGEPLVARTWGIREPADTAPVVEPDVLLVPLLAFDATGGRLGYGGGYYDRTLARLRALKPIIAIGIAHAQQRLESVPLGPHDEPLDWILTPDGPLRPIA
jgi:5-formyltetrahydrofolate cyclo-ligase